MLTIEDEWLDADVTAESINDPSIVTAMALFRDHGLDELSIRSIAALAQVPAATVQRRFGTRHGLLRQMFGRFNAAEQQHRAAALQAALGRLPTSQALARYVSAFTGDPARRAERAMLVELLAAAVRTPVLRPYAAYWVDMARGFWASLAPEAEARALAPFLVEMEVGLAVASIGCDAPLQVELANAEITGLALAGWEGLDALWFRRLLARTTAAEEVKPPPEALPFLAAGAQILAREGAAAVSFRTVAARAGRSFSAAASTFRKKSALVYGIYRYIAEQSTTSAPPWIEEPRDAAEMAAIIADMLTAQSRFAGTGLFGGTIELSFLAARSPEFADLAWRMRMTTGLYELRKNDPRFDPFADRSFLAHARACWANGLGLVQWATQPADEVRPAIERRLAAGMERFVARG